MSKQAGQPPYQGMMPGGPMPNGLKDVEAAGGSNAFDIRLPDLYNHHHNHHNNYDVFTDNFGSKLLGRDLIQGIMGDEASAGHYDDTAANNNNNNLNNSNKNNNNVAMASTSSKNLEKIWNSDDNNQLGSSNHSSSSDFSSAFMPFSNNEGLGFLRRSSSITEDLVINTNVGSNNVFASNNNNNNAIGSSSSSSSVVGNNGNSSAIGNNNNNQNNSNNALNNIIGNNIKNNNNNNVFLNTQPDNNQPSCSNNNNNSDNLSSKLSSGVESPITVATDANTANNDNPSNNNPNSLGFLETTQIMQERINSNEGWGKKPIRQDTPWVLEGSMYAGRRDDLDPPAQPTPQPEMQGPFWDQNTRISNCSESDRNFGVWTEPGRNNNIGMAGASGVGIWKTNLNMAGKPDLQAPTPQQTQLPPHLFQQQQQQQQQQWNPADPRLLLAAVAQRLSEEDSKPKWSSSSSSTSNITPWEDKHLLNTLVNNAPNHPNNPWNSSQRMDGLQSDINPNILQQLLSLGVPLENAQKFAQSNDLLAAKNKQFGGGSFDGTRGRPLFAQKLHNTAPSPLPHSFNPPPTRLDFGQPSLLHSNIFSPGNNPASMPPFNGINPQQENALKAQQLLMALQQQQQQQQQMQQNNNNNNPDLSAMMMMMMNEAKAGGDATKENVLSQLMNNMRMGDTRWMPGNNNNNNNNNDNNWNLPHQDESAFFNNNNNNMNNNQGGGGGGMGGHLFNNNNNNNRLPGWQNNKLPHPNTANIAYNWLFIKNFSGDPPSLQFIGSQNRAMKYFGGLQSNSVLVFFPSTEDAMKAKAQFAMAGMQFELLDNATANRELQSGMWNALPPTPHHHQPFLPRPPIAPGAMWPPVRF